MKISNSQFCVLLILVRIFTLIAYFPQSGGISQGSHMLGILLSSVAQCVMILPILALNKTFSGKNLAEIAKIENLVFGKTIALIYVVFFVFSAAKTVADFQKFSAETFPSNGNWLSGAVILVGVAVYAAFLGIEGIARSGWIELALFATMTVFIGIFLIVGGKADMLNFQPSYRISDGKIFTAAVEDFAKSSELVLVCVLAPFLKNSVRKGFFGYLASKIIILEVISMLIITVLGDFSQISRYPFFSLGGKLGTVGRTDAIFIVVWSIAAIIRLALFVFSSGIFLEAVFPKMKYKNIISGGLILVATAFVALTEVGKTAVSTLTSAVPLLLLFFVIPLILLIVNSLLCSPRKVRS
ncbi:MAG: GerAB/ArcD/ProY family transporter [Oscillospiraceae bacterium]